MIKLSNKWDYAIKALVYMWKNSSDLLKIWTISSDLKISESLLRRLIAQLEKSWIIQSVKWRNWWIKLWKELNKITIYDILLSVWEELGVSDCSKWLECDNHSTCWTTDVYNIIQRWFEWVLKLYTLDKIIDSKI